MVGVFRSPARPACTECVGAHRAGMHFRPILGLVAPWPARVGAVSPPPAGRHRGHGRQLILNYFASGAQGQILAAQLRQTFTAPMAILGQAAGGVDAFFRGALLCQNRMSEFAGAGQRLGFPPWPSAFRLDDRASLSGGGLTLLRGGSFHHLPGCQRDGPGYSLFLPSPFL